MTPAVVSGMFCCKKKQKKAEIVNAFREQYSFFQETIRLIEKNTVQP